MSSEEFLVEVHDFSRRMAEKVANSDNAGENGKSLTAAMFTNTWFMFLTISHFDREVAALKMIESVMRTRDLPLPPEIENRNRD